MANRRVALVGCGMVGMSYAYALLNSDLCNELIAVWDGTNGGTGNCVKYAKQTDRKINIMPPESFIK